MNSRLAEHFTYRKLLKFVFPSIIMMVFTSVYSVVDGLFVSNFVGSTPFAAVNLIMPFLMIFSAVGLMFGTGGAALVGVIRGEGKDKRANEVFSQIIYITIIIALIITVAAQIILRPVAVLLGATGELLEYCVAYGRICIFSTLPFMLQAEFQSFLITAERPSLGLAVTLCAGFTNIILDALLVAVFDMGIAGAAIATCIGMVVGGFVPLLFFVFSRTSPLKLGRASRNMSNIKKVAINGSSEFMSNVSLSIVNMAYNGQLMAMIGENGVSAYGVIMYVSFIFQAIFFGYSMGSANITSYNYGAGNRSELQNIFKKSMYIITVFSIAMLAFSEFLAGPLSSIFVGYDAELLSLTTYALRIYSISFLFAGFNIFGSALFTALNNGLISALISFLRVLGFQILAVYLIPLIMGIDGIWYSITVAEVMAIVVTMICIVKYKKVYHYA